MFTSPLYSYTQASYTLSGIFWLTHSECSDSHLAVEELLVAVSNRNGQVARQKAEQKAQVRLAFL
jgi:hypothetical protein